MKMNQLSAFAVYNNKIPNVRVYPATDPEIPSKKKRKQKIKQDKSSLKSEIEASSSQVNGSLNGNLNSISDASKSISKAAKKRSKKKKSNEKQQQQQVSAFAVYNNKVPAADVGASPLKKQSISSQNKQQNKTPTTTGTETISRIVNGSNSESSINISKSARKRNKKKKSNENKQQQQEVIILDDDDISDPITPLNNHQKTKQNGVEKSASVFEQFLPNPLHNKSKNKSKKSQQLTVSSASKSLSTSTPVSSDQDQIRQLVASAVTAINQNSNQKASKINKMSFAAEGSDDETEENEDEEVDNDPIRQLFNPKSVVYDSEKQGKSLFEWLISPIKVMDFFSSYWEKKPLHIKRTDTEFYKWIISSSKLDSILRQNNIQFGKNIDITSYSEVDGKRETHNPTGRAMPAVVWDYYANACSVRFLNPQTYVKSLWKLNASLQEYIGTFVGCNSYLTPEDSQGFAPHFDDIEAFILQVEGKKHWKIYKPISPETILPRYSSRDFTEDEIGEPVLDVIVEEGDLLYFPRGFIHQAKAVEGSHSLHLTLSCYQRNTWGDLLKEFLPLALENAVKEDLEFRKGLPISHLNYMGMSNCDSKEKSVQDKRRTFTKTAKRLLEKVINKIPIDYAVDLVAKNNLIWDSLPPMLSEKEKHLTTAADGEFLDEGKVYNRCEISPDSEVKLTRKNSIRLVYEGVEETKLYFNYENTLEYHAVEAQFMEIPLELTPIVEFLINSYPKYVKIEELPLDQDAKLQVVGDLWEKGILMTREPLSPIEMEFGSSSDEEDISENEGSDEGDSDELMDDFRPFNDDDVDEEIFCDEADEYFSSSSENESENGFNSNSSNEEIDDDDDVPTLV